MYPNTQFLNRFPRTIGILIFCFAVHLILIPILLGTFLYRGLVAVLAKLLRSDLDSFVTGIDLSFLSNPPEKALSNLVICFVVHGNISENRIQEMFQERVLQLKDSRANLIYKKLFQFSTSFLGYAFWKTDKSFTLSNHVRKYDYEDVILARPCDETSLKEVISRLQTLPWTSHQSHWETLLMSEYKRELESESDSRYSLVIFRIDHSIVDALSFIGMVRVLFQSRFSVPSAVQNVIQLSRWEKYKLSFWFPYEAAKLLPGLLHPRYLNKRDPNKPYAYDVSERIAVSTIKNIKDEHQVDHSSVLHSLVNGGISLTLETLKKTPPKYIDLSGTLALPDHPGGTCNHWRVFSTELPLRSASSIDRLIDTQNILRTCGADWSTLIPLHLAKLLGNFPETVATKIFSYMYKNGPSYTISIIPVTSSREFIDNAEIVDVYATVSASLPMGLNIFIWGINNQQRVNLIYKSNIFGSEIPKGTLSKYVAQEKKHLLQMCPKTFNMY